MKLIKIILLTTLALSSHVSLAENHGSFEQFSQTNCSNDSNGWVCLSVGELTEILIENSDEKRASVVSKALIAKAPKTTLQMAVVIREAISGFSKKVQNDEGDAPIRRAFQALRIAVNNEFGVLEQFLKDVSEMLNQGGRVAVLSFHSGEDRRVKKSFQPLEQLKVYSQVAPEFIRPSPEEQRANSRSKSAKLRWAIL